MRAGAWLALLASATVAHGHSILVDASIPLAAALVRPGVETHVALHFSGPLTARGSVVELVPEGRDARPLAPVFGPAPQDVSVTLPALEPGRYRLRYRVIAADGHVTEGSERLDVPAGR